jgi:hypothetical protein
MTMILYSASSEGMVMLPSDRQLLNDDILPKLLSSYAAAISSEIPLLFKSPGFATPFF